MNFRLEVACYSGYKADERPLRFTFGDNRVRKILEVKQLLDQWYGIGYHCFKVLADDGNLYILRHQQAEDYWVLDSFRRGPGTAPK